MTSENATPDRSEREAELRRLEDKIASITDPDIRSALEVRIRQLREQLPPPPEPVPEPEAPPEEPPSPPTPEQMERAEGFVRQARVEKMRGNTQAAADCMRKAAEAAPTAPAVLESLGDDAMERRNYKEARAAYERALKVSPKSINLERKHAQAVLHSQSALTVEQQLRLGLMDTPFLSADDITANKKSAVVLNAFLPGLGQITMGQTKKGAILLGFWIVFLIAIGLMHNDITAMFQSLQGDTKAHPTMLILVPVFGALIVYIISLADLGGKSAAHSAHRIERPKPPVDLPYE